MTTSATQMTTKTTHIAIKTTEITTRTTQITKTTQITSKQISGIHNYSNYPFMNLKYVRAICRITPENYAI